MTFRRKWYGHAVPLVGILTASLASAQSPNQKQSATATPTVTPSPSPTPVTAFPTPRPKRPESESGFGGRAVGTLKFVNDSVTVLESSGTIVYTVVREGGADAHSASWSLTNVSTDSADFTGSTAGSLSWSSGDTSSRTITINLANNAGSEPREQFKLNLVPSGSSALTAVGNIVEALPTPIVAPKPQNFDNTFLWENVPSNSQFIVTGVPSEGENGPKGDSVAVAQIANALEEWEFVENTSGPVSVKFINSANLLYNESFETRYSNDFASWTEEWTNVWSLYDSTAGYQKLDAGSLKTLPATALYNRNYQIVDVKPNTTYVFEVWVRTNNVNWAGIQVHALNSSGVADAYSTLEKVMGTNGWSLLQGTFNTGNHERATFYAMHYGSTGNAWFDAPRLYPLSSEGSTAASSTSSSRFLDIQNLPSTVRSDFWRWRGSIAPWQREQAYLLHGRKTGTGSVEYTIAGDTPQGRFYGAQALRQILQQSVKNGTTSVSLPYDFTILDYPDYPERMALAEPVWQKGSSPNFENGNYVGASMVDYLASLRINRMVNESPRFTGEFRVPVGLLPCDWSHDWVRYNYLNDPATFLWDSSTDAWIENPSSRATNYWNNINAVFKDLTDHFVTPVWQCYFSGGTPIWAIDRSVLEGAFCNQIPFKVSSTGQLVVAENAPCPSYSTDAGEDKLANLIQNGSFEQVWSGAQGTEPTTPTVINQSTIDGNNYLFIPANQGIPSTYTFVAPQYTDVEASFWMRVTGSTNPAQVFSVTGAPAGTVSYSETFPGSTPTPTTFDWVNYFSNFNTGTTTSFALNLLSTGYARRVDNILFQITNLVPNGNFEFFASNSNAHVWLENPAGGTISKAQGYDVIDEENNFHSGTSAIKLTRSTSGATHVYQDFTSFPDTVHTFTVWTRHHLTSGVAFCEVYDLEGGNIRDNTYRQSRVLGSGTQTGWYQQEFSFKSNKTGQFRIYLQLQGVGDVSFDDAHLRPEKAKYCSPQGYDFESTALTPSHWNLVSSAPAVMVPNEGADGSFCMKLQGNLDFPVSSFISNATFTLEPYTEYEFRAMYSSNHSPTAPHPRFYLLNSSGSTVFTDTIINRDDFQDKWRSYRKTFEIGNHSSGKLMLESEGFGPAYLDGISLTKNNLVNDASFELAAFGSGPWTVPPGSTASILTSGKVGNKSAQVSVGELTQVVPLEPNRDYTLEGWIKHPGGSGNAAIHMTNAGGTHLASPLTHNADTWKWVSTTFYSGSNPLFILKLKNETAGASHFDGLRVYPSNYLKNGGFDTGLPSTCSPPCSSQSTGWFRKNSDSSAGLSLDTSVPGKGGSQSLKITGSNEPYNRVFTQVIDVPPWTTIEVSYRARWIDAANTTMKMTLFSTSPIYPPDVDFAPASDEYGDGENWSYVSYASCNIGANYFEGYFEGLGSFYPEHLGNNWAQSADRPDADSNGWVTRRMAYNTGRQSKVMVEFDLRAISPTYLGGKWSGQFWLDDVKVKTVPSVPKVPLGETPPSTPAGMFARQIDNQGRVFGAIDSNGNQLMTSDNTSINSCDIVAELSAAQVYSSRCWDLDTSSTSTLAEGDVVYLSWNENLDAIFASPYHERFRNLAVKIMEKAYAELGVTRFNIKHDDILVRSQICSDSRSLTTGFPVYRLIAEGVAKLEMDAKDIETTDPEGIKIMMWGDYPDMFHGDSSKHRFASNLNNNGRSIKHLPTNTMLAPWDYAETADGSYNSAHAINYGKMTRSRNLQWIGAAGDDPSVGDLNLTAPHWTAGQLPNSNFKGVAWTTWGQPFAPTTQQPHYDGLPLTAEIDWNADGYNPTSANLTLPALPYYVHGGPGHATVPFTINSTLGDLSKSRK